MSHRQWGANSPNLSLAATSPFKLLTFQMPKCNCLNFAAELLCPSSSARALRLSTPPSNILFAVLSVLEDSKQINSSLFTLATCGNTGCTLTKFFYWLCSHFLERYLGLSVCMIRSWDYHIPLMKFSVFTNPFLTLFFLTTLFSEKK